MTRLLWLPGVLAAAGLEVRTYPGWETRGSSSWGPLRGIVCHATAGSGSDEGEMRVLWVTGSVTAPAPIAQLYLSRDGTWWVGASGLCYHVLIGQQGPHRGYGNAALIGVEAANDNRGQPWPAVQVDAYIRGVAAICRHMGWGADVVVGHGEHQSDKTDPRGLDMDEFRRRVAALLEDDMLSAEDRASIALYVLQGSDQYGFPPASLPEAVRQALAHRNLTAQVDRLTERLAAGVDVEALARLVAPRVTDELAGAVVDELLRRMAKLAPPPA